MWRKIWRGTFKSPRGIPSPLQTCTHVSMHSCAYPRVLSVCMCYQGSWAHKCSFEVIYM